MVKVMVKVTIQHLPRNPERTPPLIEKNRSSVKLAETLQDVVFGISNKKPPCKKILLWTFRDIWLQKYECLLFQFFKSQFSSKRILAQKKSFKQKL